MILYLHTRYTEFILFISDNNKANVNNVEQHDSNQVGDIDNDGGFGLGKADPNSKPKETFYDSPTKSERKQSEHAMNKTMEGSGEAEFGTYTRVPDKQTAFVEYKDSRGKETVNHIENDRILLKDYKDKIKELSNTCQELKADIENTTRKLQVMKAQEGGVIESEYFDMCKQVKEKKATYKSNLVDVKELKAKITDLNSNLEKNKQFLVSDFEKWFDEYYGAMEQTLAKEEDLEVDLEDESAVFFHAKNKVNKLHKGMHNTKKRK